MFFKPTKLIRLLPYAGSRMLDPLLVTNAGIMHERDILLFV